MSFTQGSDVEAARLHCSLLEIVEVPQSRSFVQQRETVQIPNSTSSHYLFANPPVPLSNSTCPMNLSVPLRPPRMRLLCEECLAADDDCLPLCSAKACLSPGRQTEQRILSQPCTQNVVVVFTLWRGR